MYPGGPVRKPYSYTVPSPHSWFKNSSSAFEISRSCRNASGAYTTTMYVIMNSPPSAGWTDFFIMIMCARKLPLPLCVYSVTLTHLHLHLAPSPHFPNYHTSCPPLPVLMSPEYKNKLSPLTPPPPPKKTWLIIFFFFRSKRVWQSTNMYIANMAFRQNHHSNVIKTI
jgi:hypothetical protein